MMYLRKLDMYQRHTRPIRQTFLFLRPKEEWDPTWWEIPLQPLPKFLSHSGPHVSGKSY